MNSNFLSRLLYNGGRLTLGAHAQRMFVTIVTPVYKAAKARYQLSQYNAAMDMKKENFPGSIYILRSKVMA